MRLRLLALPLLGCAHLPGLAPETGTPEYPLQCRTTCGSRVFAPPGVMVGCERYAALEASIVQTFPAGVCERLKDVIVSVQPSETWQSFGRNVAGVARCDRNSIQVGASLAALAHEVKHLTSCPDEDIEHIRWTTADWQMIDRVNANARGTNEMP